MSRQSFLEGSFVRWTGWTSNGFGRVWIHGGVISYNNPPACFDPIFLLFLHLLSDYFKSQIPCKACTMPRFSDHRTFVWCWFILQVARKMSPKLTSCVGQEKNNQNSQKFFILHFSSRQRARFCTILYAFYRNIFSRWWDKTVQNSHNIKVQMSPSAKVRSKFSSYLQPQLTLHAACFFHLDRALSLTFHACTSSDDM